MTEIDHRVRGQRGLGYVCIFSRSIEEAAAAIAREMAAGLMGCEPEQWIEQIEGWLTKDEPLTELNFGGARFSEPQWRLILESAVVHLRRNLPTART